MPEDKSLVEIEVKYHFTRGEDLRRVIYDQLHALAATLGERGYVLEFRVVEIGKTDTSWWGQGGEKKGG